MADKPAAPESTTTTAPAVSSIRDIMPGELNSYSALINHLVLDQGRFDSFSDVISEVGRRVTTPDTFGGMTGPFRAIVLRVEGAQQNNIAAMIDNATPKLISVTVTVPEFDIAKPRITKEAADKEKARKNEVGISNGKDMSAVDFYPLCLARDPSVPVPDIGDLVWVTFENVDQQTGGVYMGPVGEGGSVEFEECLKKNNCSLSQLQAAIRSGLDANKRMNERVAELSQPRQNLHPRGKAVYYAGVRTPMVIGIQSMFVKQGLGGSVTGNFDASVGEIAKAFQRKFQFSQDGMIGDVELRKMYDLGMSFWFRIYEFLGDNETGGVRVNLGKSPISVWRGGNRGISNWVPTDGAGVNYGVAGLNVTQRVLPAVLGQEDLPKTIDDATVATVLGKADSYWSAIPVTSASIATLLNSADQGALFTKHKAELFRQKAIAEMIMVSIESGASRSSTLSKYIKHIPEITDWLETSAGAMAQMKYMFQNYVGEILWVYYHLTEQLKKNSNLNQKFSPIALITEMFDVKAQYGAAAPRNSVVRGDPYLLWLLIWKKMEQGMDLAAAYGEVTAVGKFRNDALARHSTITSGSGTIHGYAVDMSTYGLTAGYDAAIKSELDSWLAANRVNLLALDLQRYGDLFIKGAPDATRKMYWQSQLIERYKEFKSDSRFSQSLRDYMSQNWVLFGAGAQFSNCMTENMGAVRQRAAALWASELSGKFNNLLRP